MQKKKENKPVKQILLFIIILIIVLLILFSKNIINLIDKNKINLAQNIENEQITNEPNIPQLSAGMIPVKWNGSNWVITTQNDDNWYNYAEGKLAYVMLNDGVYQSELIRDMGEKKLAEEHIGEPIGNSQLGTIFAWIPRFAYKESGETQYVMAETQPGGEWTIPDMFIYGVENETKPDFSLSGIWIQKDTDTSYSSKITKMNEEESTYGFLANTKATQTTPNDTTALQKYIANTVGVGVPDDPPISDITNLNRIILKIVNAKKYEPIKANIKHNAIDQKLEIRVTYTKNGISKILDEYGDNMELTENDGVIYTDTSNIGLATGTYSFTIIDNENNKKKLSIDITVDSFIFKVAYINETDNMNIDTAYEETQETITSDENRLLNQIKATDTTKTFSRAIQDKNNATTAIGEKARTSEDSQIYRYSKYVANATKHNRVEKSTSYTTITLLGNSNYWTIFGSCMIGDDGIRLMGEKKVYGPYSDGYYPILTNHPKVDDIYDYWMTKPFYYYDCISFSNSPRYEAVCNVYTMNIITYFDYSRGNFVSNVIAKDGTYTIGSSSAVHEDGYWYIRNSLAPKYTLYKYDENLILKSAYDIDTKVLTTVPINIANKGNNKVKLTLNTYGSNYKTYISNDNTNWQQVTGITSKTPKELAVDGWDKLYIKIETNTSRIDNIEVAYYKN